MAKVGRPEEWTKKRIEIEADALLEWAELNDSIILAEFPVYRDPPYTSQVMNHIASKNAKFLVALSIAKQKVAARREKGGLFGTLTPSLISKTMGFYDPDFKSYEKEMKQVDAQVKGETLAKELLEFQKIITDVQEESQS